ncbi:FadR/GntR family transcriptional regulator [Rugosimonospora acidiphila]
MSADITGDGARRDLFSPVHLGRVSGAIVEQVRLLIRQGRLKPGDRLPSERDLCESFGVSRVTVREALRVLEAGGLVEIRVGARGGAFVTVPSTERVGASLADLVGLSPLTVDDVNEARRVFELGIVPLVVERVTDEDLADLYRLCQQQRAARDDEDTSTGLSARFHVRVAGATHNAAIEMLVHSFHGPLLGSTREDQEVAPRTAGRGTREHLDFVKALERRDVEAATGIMSRHLGRGARRGRSSRSSRAVRPDTT